MGMRWSSWKFAGCFLIPFGVMAGPQEDWLKGRDLYAEGDVVSAMTLLKKAADLGHSDAQALLAYALDKAEEDELAVSYYRKSAAQDNAEGLFGLGSMMIAGEGTKQDMVEGRKYLIRAAEKGQREAVNVVVSAYMIGGLGLTTEDRESPAALPWVKIAAERNIMMALEKMVAVYRQGLLGVAPSEDEAKIWQDKIDAIRQQEAEEAKKKGRRRRR